MVVHLPPRCEDCGSLPGEPHQSWCPDHKVEEPKPPVSEAGVYTARGLGELHTLVHNLAADRFRIVTVIDTQNGDYHVVAQRDQHSG